MTLFWRKNLNRLRDQKAVLYHARNSCFFTWTISNAAECCWCIGASEEISGFCFNYDRCFSLGICYFVKHSLFDIILFFIDIMVQFPSRLLRAFAVKLTQSETLQSKSEQSPCKVRQMSRFVTLGCHQPQDKTLLLHIGVLVVRCRDVEAWW